MPREHGDVARQEQVKMSKQKLVETLRTRAKDLSPDANILQVQLALATDETGDPTDDTIEVTIMALSEIDPDNFDANIVSCLDESGVSQNVKNQVLHLATMRKARKTYPGPEKAQYN